MLAVDVGADDGQAAQRDALEVVGHEAEELRVGADGPRQHAGLSLGARAEGRRGAAELLVRDEAGYEDLARLVGAEAVEVRVPLLAEVVARGGRGLVGDEGGGLDVEQGRGDEHEVARHVEVEVAHALYLVEVLGGDLCDGYGPDGDALPAHELEQQVEGA